MVAILPGSALGIVVLPFPNSVSPRSSLVFVGSTSKDFVRSSLFRDYFPDLLGSFAFRAFLVGFQILEEFAGWCLSSEL
jgi:hypothetical protein